MFEREFKRLSEHDFKRITGNTGLKKWNTHWSGNRSGNPVFLKISLIVFRHLFNRVQTVGDNLFKITILWTSKVSGMKMRSML